MKGFAIPPQMLQMLLPLRARPALVHVSVKVGFAPGKNTNVEPITCKNTKRYFFGCRWLRYSPQILQVSPEYHVLVHLSTSNKKNRLQQTSPAKLLTSNLHTG